MDRTPIGPHVVQNMNRCIHCTRCIRFTAEITRHERAGVLQARRVDRSRRVPGHAARQLDVARASPTSARPARSPRASSASSRASGTSSRPSRSATAATSAATSSSAIARTDLPLPPARQSRGQRSLAVRLRPLLVRALRHRPRRRSEGAHRRRLPRHLDVERSARRDRATRVNGATKTAAIASANMTNEEAWLAKKLFGRHTARHRSA